MSVKEKKLDGQKIIITGASSGIGAILAEKIAQHGALPILIARSEEKLRLLAHKIMNQYNIKAPYYILDVSLKNDVKTTFQQIVDQYGEIDILINNAGYGLFEHVSNLEEEVFKQMMDVNYLGTVYCTKQVLPSMMKRKKGHIINVASQAGKISTPKTSAYSATKHAIIGFSNSLRYDLKSYNIHVTTVNPGPIQTPFFNTADTDGNYVKNVARFILDADYVAEQIIKTINKPKREVNLPRWMDWGGKITTLFPKTSEKVMSKIFSKYR